jgi:hypothetical protein
MREKDSVAETWRNWDLKSLCEKWCQHFNSRMRTSQKLCFHITNTISILIHQMRISTTKVCSVVLRPKKLEMRKQNENCTRAKKANTVPWNWAKSKYIPIQQGARVCLHGSQACDPGSNHHLHNKIKKKILTPIFAVFCSQNIDIHEFIHLTKNLKAYALAKAP